MTSPEPTHWDDDRPARLTTADLPRRCDACPTQVGLSDDGQPIGGTVLADQIRDYVFCTECAARALKANPSANTVQLPAPPPEPEPEPSTP